MLTQKTHEYYNIRMTQRIYNDEVVSNVLLNASVLD